MSRSPKLSRDEILAGLHRLDVLLGDQGIIGELCIYGGACMSLAFNARPSTKDVDAIFAPAEAIRKLAQQVSDELGFPKDWLNDGVKGFVSRHDRSALEAFHPGDGFQNLRIWVPTARYLLAMKCMAARTGINETDKADILFLAEELRLSRPEEILDIVEQFYPVGQILPKTEFFIEELRDDLENNAQSRG